MELIKYLNDNFYTNQELLGVTKVTESEFLDLQEKGVMPLCSYKLKLNLCSDSFFGEHSKEQNIEYYAKGYTSWLGILQSLNNVKDAYEVFSQRYNNEIELLRSQGFLSNDQKVTSNLAHHIEEEWGHFINGIYGLCTKSGLPEDIAAKELAVLIINKILVKNELSANELLELTSAVNLLDKAISMFAPHERLKSSRHRLINEIRSKYQLQS